MLLNTSGRSVLYLCLVHLEMFDAGFRSCNQPFILKASHARVWLNFFLFLVFKKLFEIRIIVYARILLFEFYCHLLELERRVEIRNGSSFKFQTFAVLRSIWLRFYGYPCSSLWIHCSARSLLLFWKYILSFHSLTKNIFILQFLWHFT